MTTSQQIPSRGPPGQVEGRSARAMRQGQEPEQECPEAQGRAAGASVGLAGPAAVLDRGLLRALLPSWQRTGGNAAATRRLGGARAPSVQRAPTETPPGSGRFTDPDVAGLTLTREPDEGGVQVFLIAGTQQKLYWKGDAYKTATLVKGKSGTRQKFVPFNAIGYVATSTAEFATFTTDLKAVANVTAGMPAGELKTALSMYVLQRFYANALYTATEIAHLQYQTTPLNYQDAGAYLRTRASAFVETLRDTFTDYAGADLFLARSLDFTTTLGQVFERVNAPLLAAGAVPPRATLEASLARTIERVVATVLSGGDLSTFASLPGRPLTFVDFTEALRALDTAAQATDITRLAKDYGEQVNAAVLHGSAHSLITAFVDARYPAPGTNQATRERIVSILLARFEGTATDPSALYAVLDARERAAFEAEKASDLRDLATVEGHQVLPSSDDGTQGERFSREYQRYWGWLHARRGNRSVGFTYAAGSQEATFLTARDGSVRWRAFLALTRRQGESFAQYLADDRAAIGARAYRPIDRSDDVYLDRELADLEVQLDEVSRHVPALVLTGGMLTIKDQPALLLAPGTERGLRGLVRFALNKAGQVPTPTTAAKNLLGQGHTLLEIVRSVIAKQISLNARKVETTNKLTKILSELSDFTPTATHLPTAEEATMKLEAVNAAFTDFSDLASDSREYVSILATGVKNLIENLGMLAPDSPLPAIALTDLESNLKDAVRNKDAIASFVRTIQNLHELVILALQTEAGQKKVQDTALGIPEGAQQPHFTDYGLTAFARAFNAVRQQRGDTALNVDAYANIYFELTEKLDQAVKATGGASSPTGVTTRSFQNVAEFVAEMAKIGVGATPTRPDLISIDIHPNDAAKHEMHQQQIPALIDALFSGAPKGYRCTLLVDITLNHLTELTERPRAAEQPAEEVTAEQAFGRLIMAKAKDHIDSGALNLVFIQSLTKFAQLGSDKHSGGLMFHYNRPEDWAEFNAAIAASTGVAPDPGIQAYFKALFAFTEKEQVRYLKKVRENTRFVYKGLRDEFKRLDIPEHAISIAVNDDPSTCYVAFHYEEFAAKVFGIGAPDLGEQTQKLNADVLNRAISTLMQQLGLPVSMRMSFGFPISNLGDTGKTIRLTVGVEEQAMLEQYVQVITFVNAKLATADTQVLKDRASRQTLLNDLTAPIVDARTLHEQLEPLFKKD